MKNTQRNFLESIKSAEEYYTKSHHSGDSIILEDDAYDPETFPDPDEKQNTFIINKDNFELS